MYRVDIENREGYTFNATCDSYEFTIGAKGITPPATLLASLGSCIGVYLRKYCESAKLDLGDFSLKVEADFSKDSPLRFKEIYVTLDLKGQQLEERRKKALLEFVKNCPVHNTLKNDPLVDIKII